MPLPQLLATIGFMLGTGGSAIVGITLGEGRPEKGRPLLYHVPAGRRHLRLGAGRAGACVAAAHCHPAGCQRGELLDYAVRYGRILMLSLPTFALQNMFQASLSPPKSRTSAFYFRSGCRLHQHGAGCADGGRLGLGRRRCRHCHLPPARSWAACCRSSTSSTTRVPAACTCAKRSCTARCCWTPASMAPPRLMTNLSMSLVNILYNYQLLRFAGKTAWPPTASSCTPASCSFAVYVGCAFGSAPIVSFHYGAGKPCRGAQPV